MNSSRSTVVKVGEGNFVLGANLVAYNNFVNIIELIPILIIVKLILVKGFKLWASWNRHVQRLCGVETFLIEQVEIVFIDKVTQKLVSKSVQVRHHWQGESPVPI